MRLHPLTDATLITVSRFAIMLVTLETAAAVGVDGWYLGLLANVAVTIFAVVVVTTGPPATAR